MPFNFDEYQVNVKSWSTPYIQDQIRNYIRQGTGSSASGGIGVALAPFTAGLSLVGTAISATTYANALKKVGILRDELEKREEAEDRIRKRDILLPVAFAVGTAGITHGTGSALHSVAHNAVQHGHTAILNNPHAVTLGSKAIEQGTGYAYGQAGKKIGNTI